MWDFIDTSISTAEENMRYDRELLGALEKRERPLLHLYEWKGPSYTYGHFCKPETLIDVAAAERHGFSGARRVTGGGVIFHTNDFAFSVVVPKRSEFFSSDIVDNYRFINEIVIGVIRTVVDMPLFLACDAPSPPPTFCMKAPTRYDVVDSEGRKVAGAAQRTMKHGFLHHGTISLAAPDQNVLADIVGKSVAHSMRAAAFSMAAEGEIEKVRNMLKESFAAVVL